MTLERWTQDVLTRRSRPLPRSVQVEGVRKAHLGPMLQVASVRFVAEPAERFSVVVEVPGVEGHADRVAFIEAAVFGLLDIVLLSEPQPMREMRLRLVAAEFDPVNASVMAFRLAGRDAGQHLVEALRG